MQRIWKFSLISTALYLPCFSAIADPVSRTAPLSGQVVSVRQGEDIVFTQEDTRRKIVTRQDLKAGDVLRTNAKGAMSIVFADQTQIRLARNTTLEVKAVAQGSPSAIHIAKGNVWARTPRGKSQLSISTPSATAAIRGTEWALQVRDGETSLQVASGNVSFFNGQGQLEIQGGQAAIALLGQAPVRTVIVNRTGREQMLYFLTKPTQTFNIPSLSQAYEAAYLGEFDQALNIIQESTNPQIEHLLLKARIGFLTGRVDIIETALEAGFSQNPNDSRFLELRAHYNAYYKGRPDLALKDAEHAAELAPNDADILLTLSKIHLERHHDIKAMELMTAAIEIAPKTAELYVHKADIHLFQNNLNAARTALDTAFKISPNLDIARLGYGQIYALEGRESEALSEFLAASAANPGYSRALLRLAETYGRQGESDVAEQQLDAADRLDPNSPYTPLYRTALALDHYEGGKAIAGAQDALERFQARGGLYENLSESRETGSNISRAFRFMKLEPWGRYYGDRAFDSFLATSYFDQTLNETAGPFLIRQDNTSFNPQNGDDLDQISSFLQGVVLDPLSVASAERPLQISKEAFLEATLGADTIQSERSNLLRGSASIQGRTYTGFGKTDIPIAFSLKAERSRFEEDTLQFSNTDTLDQVRETDFLEAYAGIEFSPSDDLTLFASYRNNESLTRESLNISLNTGDRFRSQNKDYFGFAFWNHSFSDRNAVILGGGIGKRESLTETRTVDAPSVGEELVNLNPDEVEYYYLSATYARTLGNFDLRIGAEGFWNDLRPRQIEQVILPNQNDPVILSSNETVSDIDEQRAYADILYKVSDTFTLQGQISLLHEYDTARQISAQKPDKRDSLNYHLGAAYEPRRGHWVRAAFVRENETKTPFTMAPLHTLGLKGSLVPTVQGFVLKSRIFRWEAEWSNTLFTSVEYQAQNTGFAQYTRPNGGQNVAIDSGKIRQWNVGVNYIPGGNWALHANYINVDSEVRSESSKGLRIPFVPKTTAKLGVIWTHPSRISTHLTGIYTGAQDDTIRLPIEGYFTADAFARWEPFNKRFSIRAGVLNLLDNDHEVTIGLPPPGRTFFVAAKARF